MGYDPQRNLLRKITVKLQAIRKDPEENVLGPNSETFLLFLGELRRWPSLFEEISISTIRCCTVLYISPLLAPCLSSRFIQCTHQIVHTMISQHPLGDKYALHAATDSVMAAKRIAEICSAWHSSCRRASL